MHAEKTLEQVNSGECSWLFHSQSHAKSYKFFWKEIILSQSEVRSRSLKRAAVDFATRWRGVACLVTFGKMKRGECPCKRRILRITTAFILTQFSAVISCQMIHRQNIAKTELEMLRLKHRRAAASAIQSRWRACIAIEQFDPAKAQLVMI